MRKPALVVTTLVAALTLLVSPAEAADGTSTYYSGSTGSGYAIRCAESAILSGVVTGPGTSRFQASAGSAAKQGTYPSCSAVLGLSGGSIGASVAIQYQYSGVWYSYTATPTYQNVIGQSSVATPLLTMAGCRVTARAVGAHQVLLNGAIRSGLSASTTRTTGGCSA